MAGRIEAKLAEIGITLPTPMPPIANYVPYVVTGNLVVVSGQVPARDGAVAITGRVGVSLSIEQGKEAAQLCFVNVLAHLKAACDGNLDRGELHRAGAPDFLRVFPPPCSLPVGPGLVGLVLFQRLVHDGQ